MKTHLIKSSELDPEIFTQVVTMLQGVPGPITFTHDADAVIDFNDEELVTKTIRNRKEFETTAELRQPKAQYSLRKFPMERPTADWDTIFNKCNEYRTSHRITDDEFVILLTDVPNSNNWFASLDEEMPTNGFVHTADWDHYIECSPAFPVAYEVIALMLQKHMFEGQAALREAVHQTPIGCVNDMCMQKSQVILKLRTADICRDCMTMLKGKLPMPVIHHALTILESLRVKMLYAQNFRQNAPLSRLIVTPRSIFLPDFGNIEIRLRPLDRALYIFFLRHPEGIFHSSLCDHRQELFDIYTNISNMGSLDEMKQRIDDMVNVLTGSANEKISRIKRVFEEAIGVDLAVHYYIKGNVGEARKIGIDRELVHFPNGPGHA